MIAITAKTAAGEILAAASHAEEALVCFDREYAPGDVIEITAEPGAHLWVQPDFSVPPGEVYLPGGRMTWAVPAGEHRLAYRPAPHRLGPAHDGP